ncbi:MAG TPA: hypothetical protein VGM67_12255 [Gemmatimonadaceae bacterium]|jgi:hypothetical protein
MTDRLNDRASSRRDEELARLLRDADATMRPSAAQLRALGARIVKAGLPVLDARAASERTVWDYAERWSTVLLPVGAFTAIAAGLCLFVLSSSSEPALPRGNATRVALIGAATNRVSSQNLLDMLVAGDAPVAVTRRNEP